MARQMRVTLLGGGTCPSLRPLSASSHVPCKCQYPKVRSSHINTAYRDYIFRMDAAHTVTSNNDSLDRGQRRLILTARLRCLHVFLHPANPTSKTDFQQGPWVIRVSLNILSVYRRTADTGDNNIDITTGSILCAVLQREDGEGKQTCAIWSTVNRAGTVK